MTHDEKENAEYQQSLNDQLNNGVGTIEYKFFHNKTQITFDQYQGHTLYTQQNDVDYSLNVTKAGDFQMYEINYLPIKPL